MWLYVSKICLFLFSCSTCTLKSFWNNTRFGQVKGKKALCFSGSVCSSFIVDCWHMPTLPFSFGIVYVWTMHKIFICIYTTLVCTRILPKPELSELFSLLYCHFLKVKNAYKLMTILIDMNVYYQVNKKFIINEINF